MGRHKYCFKSALSSRNLDPILTHDAFSSQETKSQRHLGQFSHFCTVHSCAQIQSQYTVCVTSAATGPINALYAGDVV